MARRRRIRPVIKDTITCDIPLNDTVAVPFSRLQDKFTAFAETKGIDLKDVKITERGISGTFTDQSGVDYDVNFTPAENGKKSHLNGSISKKISGNMDVVNTGMSAREFTGALLE